MRLRAKLLAFNLALVPVCVGVVALISVHAQQQVFAANAERARQDALAVLELAQRDREQRMDVMIQPLAQDARIRAALVDPTEDSRTELARLDEFPAEPGELLALIGEDAHVDYAKVEGSSGARLGDGLLGTPQMRALLRAALQGPSGRAQMLWSGPRLIEEAQGTVAAKAFGALRAPLYFAQATRMSYAPGTPEERHIGVAVLAIPHLDFQRLSGTGVDVVYSDGSRLLADTLSKPRTETRLDPVAGAVAAWMGSTHPADVDRWQSRSFAGEPFSVVALPDQGLVAGPVRGALLYSRAAEVRLQRIVLRRIGFLALLFVAIVLGFGLWQVRDLSRPVLALAHAAQRVKSGDFDAKVPEGRADELGALALQFNRMVQGLKERERAQAALGRYLSPEMAHALIHQSAGVELNGERRTLSVIFGDIAGFTSLSEERAPEEVVRLLNQLFDGLVPVLFAHGGYIDKFAGDAVMAFWNAPLAQEDHAKRSCSAALALQAELEAHNQRIADPRQRFQMRWGLNTGEAVVGNLGSSSKVNYTAIGDSVNLASRLESANKLYGTSILVGETTAAACPGFAFREVDALRVKGKRQSIRIYELLGREDALPPPQQTCRKAYAEGLRLYRGRSFEAAADYFRKADGAIDGGDGPSRLFLERCEAFLTQPPPEDWDGAYTATRKD